jgi:hypothetical protein
MTKSRWFHGAGRMGARSRWLVIALATIALLFTCERTASAQAAGNSNSGALHFTGGLDVPSVYVFRGYVQETDPKLTLFPYGDLAIALTSGEGLVKSTVVNVGIWDSLNTGSSGTDGPSGHAHYEEEFYARLNWLFGGGIAVGVGYMARTSPNNMFDTEKEFQIKVAKSGKLNPYVFLASELTGDGQADSGIGKGTYLELGAVPNFPIGGRARLAIPAKAGFSLHDYYELAGDDHPFGYFNVGAMLTRPLGTVPARFGFWNVHGGAELYMLGDATKVSNRGDTLKPVAFVGVGVTY